MTTRTKTKAQKALAGRAAPSMTVGEQCGWAYGSEWSGSFTMCVHPEGHDGGHAAHYEVWGGLRLGEHERRPWAPEWAWRSVLDQDRDRFRRRIASVEARAASAPVSRPSRRGGTK